MRPLRGFAARALDLRSARLPCVSAVALTSAHLYGFEATSQWFKRRTLDPYLIKRSEGITYLCFGNQLNRPIAPPCGTPRCGGSPFGRRFPSKQLRNAEAVSSAHSRIDRDENGSVRQSWAFGRWADAESLRYIPINETMEVKREVYEGEFG